jgi:hypothetical protein
MEIILQTDTSGKPFDSASNPISPLEGAFQLSYRRYHLKISRWTTTNQSMSPVTEGWWEAR